MSDDSTRQPREWPETFANGERMVPLCCQKCGVQMGLRSPGPPPDPERVASFCFDCSPIELAEAAMNARPTDA